ncbi:MAG TPA: hypothetical protein VFA11_16890 [Acidimicrobiales bacterium]|nr:hypothetical protein [Acidimicrobiales bacterium]
MVDSRAGANRGATKGKSPGRLMERNERLATLAAAVLSVAAGVGFLAAFLVGHHRGHTSGTAVAVYTAGDFVFAGILAWAARAGNRFATGMIAVVGGFLLWGSTAISFPYLALAAWLLVRNSRAMRAQRDAERAAAPARPRPAPAEKRAGGWFSRRKRSADTGPGGVRRPPPSKRYTPPRPPAKGGRKR